MRIRVKIDSVRMDGYSRALSRIGGRARPRRGPLAGGWGVAAARGAPAGRQEHGLARAAAAADPMLQQGRGERIGGDLRRGRWVGVGGGDSAAPTAGRRPPEGGERARGGGGRGWSTYPCVLANPSPPFRPAPRPPPRTQSASTVDARGRLARAHQRRRRRQPRVGRWQEGGGGGVSTPSGAPFFLTCWLSTELYSLHGRGGTSVAGRVLWVAARRNRPCPPQGRRGMGVRAFARRSVQSTVQ